LNNQELETLMQSERFQNLKMNKN